MSSCMYAATEPADGGLGARGHSAANDLPSVPRGFLGASRQCGGSGGGGDPWRAGMLGSAGGVTAAGSRRVAGHHHHHHPLSRQQHRSLKRSTYKHVPHRDKPPHMVARRNARERRRVQAVNTAFVRLRRHIPYENKNKRLSKVKTLRVAIDYIQHMQSLIADYDSKHPATSAGPGPAAPGAYCSAGGGGGPPGAAGAAGLGSHGSRHGPSSAESAKENRAWCAMHINFSGELGSGDGGLPTQGGGYPGVEHGFFPAP